LVAVLNSEPSLVRADPGQIEQVILNLAVNARDAMPRGGRLILETSPAQMDESQVRDGIVPRVGSYVRLAVSDTGCGMDSETLAHVFDPFFTTKEMGRGTGLGLAMVFGIIKQSEGAIVVASQPGEGTKFEIYLPQAAEGSPDSEFGVNRDPASLDGNETILLVEDEDALRRLLSESLASRGYRVMQASRGDDALSLARTHSGPIHLLIADLVMPRMSGRELAQSLSEIHGETRVLFISGYTQDVEIHREIAESEAAFLQKPFTPDALARRVRELLDSSVGYEEVALK
jgi:CheY-like chemotaxis protein